MRRRSSAIYDVCSNSYCVICAPIKQTRISGKHNRERGGDLLSGPVETAQSLCHTPTSLIRNVEKIVCLIFEIQDVFVKAETPGKLTVERIEEIEEYPGDYDTVVDADETVDDEARYSDPDKVWRDGVPRHDGALHGGLTEGQLQVEEGDTENKQHDSVR